VGDHPNGFIQKDCDATLLLGPGFGRQFDALMGVGPGAEFLHYCAIEQNKALFNKSVSLAPRADATVGQKL
jgi:hypothetical protein